VDSDYRVQRFRSAELYRLHPAEQPPMIGWSIGADGLFRDGVRVAYHTEVQISAPGSIEVRYIPLQPR
jgi:hypothetical protein